MQIPSSRSVKPRIFIDSDVLFAGSASPSENGASIVLLRMAEITLIDAVVSQQVLVEVERNLTAKIPSALSTFHHLVNRCVTVVPSPTASEMSAYAGLADSKDLSILVAALQSKSAWLATFNIRHFQPGHPDVTVLRPGNLLLRVRGLLAHL